MFTTPRIVMASQIAGASQNIGGDMLERKGAAFILNALYNANFNQRARERRAFNSLIIYRRKASHFFSLYMKIFFHSRKYFWK